MAEASRAFDMPPSEIEEWVDEAKRGMECVHRHRFESLQNASRVIAEWIGFYNNRRPHQALGMKTSAEAIALAA